MSLSASELKQMIDEYEDNDRPTEQGAANLQTALSSYIRSRETAGMNTAISSSRDQIQKLNQHRIIRRAK